jgi:hypothetical protein
MNQSSTGQGDSNSERVCVQVACWMLKTKFSIMSYLEILILGYPDT